MKAKLALLSMFAVAFIALTADAADRMRAGQWVGTWAGGGRTRATSDCMSQSDVEALNGDAKSVRAYLEKVIPPTICKITDLKVAGSQIVYTSTCASGPPKVVTTTYHGDSFESTSTGGDKSEAKLMGACK